MQLHMHLARPRECHCSPAVRPLPHAFDAGPARYMCACMFMCVCIVCGGGGGGGDILQHTRYACRFAACTTPPPPHGLSAHLSCSLRLPAPRVAPRLLCAPPTHRGGPNAAAHIEILGNDGVIADVIRVAAGRSDELQDEIHSDIDRIGERATAL